MDDEDRTGGSLDMENIYKCYMHDYFSFVDPCPGEHAYEGDREYFNHKIAKLEDKVEGITEALSYYRNLLKRIPEHTGDIAKLQGEVDANNERIDQLSRVVIMMRGILYEATGNWVDLNDSFTHSSPLRAKKRGRPSKETFALHSAGWEAITDVRGDAVARKRDK